MAALAPQFDQHFPDAPGGWFHTYASGTTTPKQTYKDQAGVINHTLPTAGVPLSGIALDPYGRIPVGFFLGSGEYTFHLYTAAGVLVKTWDDVGGSETVGAADTLRAELNTASGGSFIYPLGNYSYLFGDGAADNSGSIAAINAAGKPLFVVGTLRIAVAKAITVPIVDTMAQIFTTASAITIDNGLPVRPEWFGSAAGNIRLAVNALPSTGGVVKLEDKTYPPSYSTVTAAKVLDGTNSAGVDYLSKTGVKIVGAKVPNMKAVSGGLVPGLEGGTIIQGPFFVQADNFDIDNLGVDSGPDVCAALYAGVAQEGLMLLQTNQVAPFFRGGAKVGKVIGLCKGGAELVHACLFEALTDGTIQEATGVQSFHGVVIKSQNIKAGFLRGLENGGEGVICKSDSYAPMGPVQIDQVEASSIDAGVDAGFGFLVDAVTASASSVQVGSVRAYRKANGCVVRSNGAIASDVQIGEVVTDACPIGYLLSGDVRRVHVGSLVANNATYGAQVEPAVSSPSNSIAAVKVTNATHGIHLGGKLAVGDLSTDNVTGYAVNYYDIAARLALATHREATGTVAAFWPLQPTLAGSWANEGTAGNPLFRMTIDGGRVQLSGFIKGGAATTVVAAFSVQVRPPENLTFVCAGFNGATLVPVAVQITTAGAIVIPGYAAAPTYISLDGCEWLIPA